MSFTTPLRRVLSLPLLKALDRQDALRIACILALFLAIFSGRFSFARFIDETARADWLQLRIWFTGIALLGWAAMRREGVARRHVGREIGLWLCVFAVFYLYLLANTLLLGDAASAPRHVADILITTIQAFLVVQIVRCEEDLAWFARIAEALGVLLFLFCIAGFGNPDVNGAGWAPFGGPITFYRIEFLTFCSALYLFARGRGRLTWLHLPAATIGLFCAFASLSKVAVAGGLAVAAFFVFWLLSVRRPREAVIVSLAVAVTFSVFHQLRGEILKARINEGLLSSAAPLATRDGDWLIDGVRRVQSGEKLRLADLPQWQQDYVRGILGSKDAEMPSLADPLERLSRIVVYEDNSGRARLWLHALELLGENRWLGAGVGNYHLEQVNRYSKEIQIYRYPHNIVLELAATTGIVGLALFALLTLLSFVLLQQRMMTEPPLLYAAGYPLFVLLTALASGDYFDYRLFWLFTLIIAAATAPDSKQALAEEGRPDGLQSKGF